MKRNMSRRHFLKTGGLALAAMAMCPPLSFASSEMPVQKYISLRPPVGKRHFVSKAVEATIEQTRPKIKDEKLRWMFENCFPNTLDTTVRYKMKAGRPDTFVITGDIDAMWLRDSSAQVWPYLPLMKDDKELQLLIAGLINRQAECIRIDPYANAFNDGPLGSYWETDHTQHMVKELHERKWEIDSLCYPIRLAYHYWLLTKDISAVDADWHETMKLVVQTFKEQQRKQGLGPYSFTRDCDRPTDSQINNGWGAPVKPVGLIVSSFRPSDDATQYGFLIPSNMFAVVSLRQLAEIERRFMIIFPLRKNVLHWRMKWMPLSVDMEHSIILYAGGYMLSKWMVSVMPFVWTMPMFLVYWRLLIWATVRLRMPSTGIPVK